ncbi:MAG: Stp1/IreP family PP2C-type Ser/Thr phosphatase [Candidatus Nitricoxidivorans perseverans]|uniref:Stp1/IreP family PP2C-type Ser/Thr phosphatase n=1 Tax=Candidatus Nitricoxidivorans perseverans TaxID=2975601 RepID=A0AA49IYV7_9PROT|nr:MAG: Stp1/IreP family PP2C-type Ser/Thr phosphatase [Candidatus Nitricoxidivorans perseverans]
MNLSQTLEIATRSDAGMVRTHNEDAVFTNPALGLVVLADGMGGYNAGEVASGMATALLGSELEKALAEQPPGGRDAGGRARAHGVLEAEIARANSAIYQAAQSQPQYAGMGTTLVMALFRDDMMTVAHIGDSRLYRLRGEAFQQVTRDHSLLQEQIDGGMITPEQARHSQNRNLVTRALGVDPGVEPEIRDYAVLPGDVYLLCSDGLNDMVEDEEIAMTLSTLSANLALCAEQLVQMANDNGGRDNVSVILVRVKREFPAARGWWARLLAWLK